MESAAAEGNRGGATIAAAAAAPGAHAGRGTVPPRPGHRAGHGADHAGRGGGAEGTAPPSAAGILRGTVAMFKG